MQEQVYAFLMREAAGAEKTRCRERLRCGAFAGGLSYGANGVDIDRVGVDGELAAGNREMLCEIIGHGLGLTQDPVCVWIKHAIGESMRSSRCGRGRSGVLPD